MENKKQSIDDLIGDPASGRPAFSQPPRGRAVSLKTVIAGAIILVVFAIAGVLTFIYSGVFDVTATNPHWGVTYRLMSTVREQSIKRQAQDVKVPELDDPQKIHMGFKNYHAMCVACHNAPGQAPTELSKGLYPEAPNLARSAKTRTSAELYMVIKNGLKMSGMPAWESTHSGDEIWALVAFLRTLPNVSDDEYRAAVKFYEEGGVTLHH